MFVDARGLCPRAIWLCVVLAPLFSCDVLIVRLLAALVEGASQMMRMSCANLSHHLLRRISDGTLLNYMLMLVA